MPINLQAPHTIINARDPASKPVLLNGALEGHVLVKNTNNTLPLKKPKLLSIFGYDAVAPPQSDISSNSGGLYVFGDEAYQQIGLYGGFLSYTPLGAYAPNGTIISGGGSGANAPAYVSAPFDAISEQAYQDDTALYWDFTINSEPAVDPASDACLVFINAFASEGHDRPGLRGNSPSLLPQWAKLTLTDDFSDALIQNVADSCSNTIVTIHNAGIRLVDQWIDHPNITAVIFAHLPGQDSGRALVQLLYGYQSFSGKLPYTVAKNESDYNVLHPDYPEGEFALFPQSNFSEGVYIDYRDFDAKNITPRYEFGFGLSYTTFEYSDLVVELVPDVNTAYYPPDETIIPGGAASLWDVVAHVSATIKNTGPVDAAEVAQLYVGIPNGPIRQLRGFSKVGIAPGQNITVEFDLFRRDLSEWSTLDQRWVLQQASYPIYVGASSRDLPLTGSLAIR